MSTVRNKSRYDKEMSAVTYNMKEQRVLEKSMQTLKLEQSYALKLLELDNRIIKVHYKKLKERVSKIKSHLPPEDISKFRDLDQRGKLKSTQSTVSLNSAVKIAAASRRLNLNSSRNGNRRNIRSALPRIRVAPDNDTMASKSAVSFSNPVVVGKLQRSNSVTGVFIDAPEPGQASQRPVSAIVYSTSEQNGALESPRIPESLVVDPSPVNGDVDHLLKVDSARAYHRPTSSVNFKVDQNSQGEKRVQSAALPKRASTAPHPSHSHSRFSSHTATEKEATGTASSTPRVDPTRRMSHISNDSIDSNLGENLFEERRQELLEEEGVRAATLDRRTKSFLQDVEEYLKQNPPLQASHVAFEHALPEPPRRDSLATPPTKDPFGDNPPPRQRMGRRNDRPSDQNLVPTFFPEDSYRQKLLSLWKDMSKCRYLRVPDEKIDLSGVNTLVKDQMKLFDVLRNTDA